MCMLSTIGREFIVHWATRPPYKLKLQHLRAKWPPDLMLSRVQTKLLITINDLFELWKVNAVLNVS
jgi:hypothetical protein